MVDLDLKSLQAAELRQEDVVTDDEKQTYGSKIPVVKLTFDSIRKDRKERTFVMEDLENAEV